jgi:hypothetical protein
MFIDILSLLSRRNRSNSWDYMKVRVEKVLSRKKEDRRK